jgi:hypothetical protein
MSELFKNIKNLFFSYMSIMVLLFFAVLQSDQRKYENAIEQLHEVDLLAQKHKREDYSSLVNQKIPDNRKQVKSTYFSNILKGNIHFSYSLTETNFSIVDKHFSFKGMSGFNFGVSNRERLPVDFTKTKSVQTFSSAGPLPENIEAYKKIHDASLKDLVASPHGALDKICKK